jgi:hypothetical protein
MTHIRHFRTENVTICESIFYVAIKFLSIL